MPPKPETLPALLARTQRERRMPPLITVASDEPLLALEAQDAIRATATRDAPWFVVPADNKWFLRLVVAAAIVEAMEGMKLAYPKVTDAQEADLARARELLLTEKK